MRSSACQWGYRSFIMVKFVALAMLALGVVLMVPTEVQAADPFAKGTQWTGERYSSNGTPQPKWSLKITERTGTKFEGVIRIGTGKNKSDSYKVSGTATNQVQGKVAMTSEKSGAFEQTFTGQLKNGEIDFNYAGKNETGKAVKGTATLRMKK